MTYRVGIPRALLYYDFQTLWHTFFGCLGAETVASGETNKLILDLGTAKIVDEACLPVKIFFGHAIDLAQKGLDYIFVPRMVSIEKKVFICPKTMGLPDMLEAGRTELPTLIKPTMNLASSPGRIDSFLWETGSFFRADMRKIRKAWREAVAEQTKTDAQARRYEDGCAPEGGLTVLLLGHSYLLQDKYLNLNIHDKLVRSGCRVVTPEQFPPEAQEKEVENLPKRLFWTYGKILMGTVRCFSRFPTDKGVIILTSFGCGIDSFVGNMVMRYLHKTGIPYLNIILDEHTGEAGVDTRLEAFLDMMCWRRRANEGNISPHGPYLGYDERIARIPGAGCDRTPTNH